MPVIKQQKPPTPVQPALKLNGSILSTAVPTTALKETHLKVCVYGRNRVGKTTWACQFPKPMLLISFEPEINGGAMSVSNMEGVSFIRINHKPIIGVDGNAEKFKGSAKAVMLANELQASNPFKTVVIDTVTSLQEIIFTELMGLTEIPTMLSWGIAGDQLYQQRAEKTRETLRRFMDLNNCHVVFLAQEKDHNPVVGDRGKSKILQTMQQQSFFAADLGGTNAKWLQDGCGYVVQLYEDEIMQDIQIPSKDEMGKPITKTETVGTGKRGRHLRCLYHPNFAGGFRSPNPQVVPEFITAPTPNEMYVKFIKLTQGIAVK